MSTGAQKAGPLPPERKQHFVERLEPIGIWAEVGESSKAEASHRLRQVAKILELQSEPGTI
jgi:hypothetical protein